MKSRRLVVRVLPSFENASDQDRCQLAQELGYLLEPLSLQELKDRDSQIDDDKRLRITGKADFRHNFLTADPEIIPFLLTEAEIADLSAPFTVVNRKRASPSDTTVHIHVRALAWDDFELIKYRMRKAKCLRLESIEAL